MGLTPEAQITNLLYRYAEAIDTGNFDSAATLFARARLKVGPDRETDAAGMLALWRQFIVIHPDGTPRTKHIVTNPIVDIDGDTATCRSYYTVLQQTADFPLQAVLAGRYHDRFERVDGQWRFAYRDYTLMDHHGDLSHHLRMSL